MAAPVQLDLPRWEDETISTVFNVTLKVCSSLSALWDCVRWLLAARSGREDFVRGRVAEESRGRIAGRGYVTLPPFDLLVV